MSKSQKWVLSAPQTVAGLHRASNPLVQQGFSGAVAQFRSSVTSLPGYGHLSSTVSAIYQHSSGGVVGFIGFNGTYKRQIVLKLNNGLKPTSVSAGPHGGTAQCATSGVAAICEWSTSSTVGIVIIQPTGPSSANTVAAASQLMLKIRNDVEKPTH